MASEPLVSVVTPTLRRPEEVRGLLRNLALQRHLPLELVLVDGAPVEERATEHVVAREAGELPYAVRYVRGARGTAIQRNTGIGYARGEFVAFVDDDIRLDPDFLERIVETFGQDGEGRVGGIVGYRTNQHFEPDQSARWRWYRRLGLLETFEPGRYDFRCGYPVNANLQPPFQGTRPVDFMTTSCAVWRRAVLDSGLRFDPFFSDYGVLEDAHFSLRAGRSWRLLQAGDARCRHDASPNGRTDRRRLGYKCVVNYYYVFRDVAGPLSPGQRFRFWRFQAFELLRVGASGLRRLRRGDFSELFGRLQGFWAVMVWRKGATA